MRRTKHSVCVWCTTCWEIVIRKKHSLMCVSVDKVHCQCELCSQLGQFHYLRVAFKPYLMLQSCYSWHKDIPFLFFLLSLSCHCIYVPRTETALLGYGHNYQKAFCFLHLRSMGKVTSSGPVITEWMIVQCPHSAWTSMASKLKYLWPGSRGLALSQFQAVAATSKTEWYVSSLPSPPTSYS